MGLADKSQYEYLFEALVKEFPALQKQPSGDNEPGVYFQYTGQPIEAKWVTGKDYPAFVLGNTSNGDTSGFYSGSDSQISESFRTYMASIAPTNMQADPQYQTYQKQLDALIGNGTTISTDANNAFKTWLAQNPDYKKDFEGFGGFTTWLSAEGTAGPSWKTKIDQNTAQQNQVIANQILLVKAIDQPLADAKAKAIDPAYEASYVNSGVTIKAPLTNIQALSGALSDWTSAAAGQYELDATINAESKYVGSWNRNVKTTVTKKCCSVSTHTEIDYNRILQDSKYNFNIKAVGARVFTANRGDWYNPAFMTASNVEFPTGSRFTLKDYFGENGMLAMIPVSFLVIYKPSVEITISKTTYEQTVKNYFDASASVSFFGMEFSMAAGESKMVKEIDSETVKITLDANSGPNAFPMLFGASSKSYFRPGLT